MQPPWALDLMNLFNVLRRGALKIVKGAVGGDLKDILMASYLTVIAKTSWHLIS